MRAPATIATTASPRARGRAGRRPWPIAGLGVIIALLAPGLASCAGTAAFEEAAPASGTIAVWPIDNRSGVDITNVPGLLWRSSDLLRMVLQVESSEAPLAQWPFDEPGQLPAAVPADSALRTHLTYDAEAGLLTWREGMTHEERDRLLALSDEPSWHTAVRTLFARSQRDRVDIADLLQRTLAVGLHERGYTTTRLAPQDLPAGANYAQRLAATVEATDAAAVLIVALERWDFADVFATGEMRVAATAILVEPTTRALLWRHSTGPLRIRVAAADAGPAGLIDMRPTYPRLAAMLADRLLHADAR